MTIQEAIKVMQVMKDAIENGLWIHSIDEEALDMAIEALSAQPEIIRCKDCVAYGEALAGRDTRMICHKFALNFPRDFYCADAERKDNG